MVSVKIDNEKGQNRGCYLGLSVSLRVFFDYDVLSCCFCGMDGVDSSLVEVVDQIISYVVIFVVGVKDDFVVVDEEFGNGGLLGCEVSYIGYDVVVVVVKVVGVNDGIGVFVGDIVDDLEFYQ